MTNFNNKNDKGNVRNIEAGRTWARLQVRTGATEGTIQLDILPFLLANCSVRMGRDAKLRQHKHRRQQEDAAAFPIAVQGYDHCNMDD